MYLSYQTPFTSPLIFFLTTAIAADFLSNYYFATDFLSNYCFLLFLFSSAESTESATQSAAEPVLYGFAFCKTHFVIDSLR